MKFLTKLWLTLEYQYCMVNSYLAINRNDLGAEMYYNTRADEIYLNIEEIK